MKNGFSPWRTKENSIEVQQEDQMYINYTEQRTIHLIKNNKLGSNLGVGKIAQRRPNSNVSIKKTHEANNFLMSTIARQTTQRFATLQKKRYSISSQKYNDDQGQSNKKIFENQKWKTLSHHSKEAFQQEYAKIKRQRLNSTRCRFKDENNQQRKGKQSRIALQQVAVKNFVIHGSYQSENNQASIFNIKKKESSFILKQKFAELRKSMNVIKNKQNVFKVVKLQRQINNKLNTLNDQVKIR